MEKTTLLVGIDEVGRRPGFWVGVEQKWGELTCAIVVWTRIESGILRGLSWQNLGNG